MSLFYKRFRLVVALVFLGSLLPRPAATQEETKLEAGDSYIRFQEVQRDFSEKLPELISRGEIRLKELSQNKMPSDLPELRKRVSAVVDILQKLKEDPNFDPIKSSLEQIRTSLSQMDEALARKDLRSARDSLRRALTTAKVLEKSPLLQITLAEIDLDQASRRVNQKDFAGSAAYLEKSLSRLQGLKIEGNPKIQSELDGLKNEIVIVHQQTIMGKRQDDLSNRSIWKRMQQAQVESLSHYYD